MNNHKLLAGAFVMLMVASLVFPAYADERGRPDYTNPQQIFLSQSDGPVVHQNGDPSFGVSNFIDDTLIADDFVLSSGFIITDAHFVSQLNNDNDILVEPLFYFIWEDDGGEPGLEIASGTATNVQIMDIDPIDTEDGIVEISFDFEDGVPLDGGVPFWFGLKYADVFTVIDPSPKWIATTSQLEDEARKTFTLSPGPGDWDGADNSGYFFELTAHDDIVGGELLPIDTTALMLAGIQSSAIWMLPALVGITGVGAYFVRTRMNKE